MDKSLSYEMASKRPDLIKLSIVNGSGHQIQMENPKLLVEFMIRDFEETFEKAKETQNSQNSQNFSPYFA